VIEATEIAAPLDDYLMQVVQTLHTAVNQGMRRVNDDPQGANKPIHDCEEMLDIIMAGNVKEWIG
jgi:hypothetical protein